MDELNLQFNYYGALNLHKALLEAKFNLEPDNELVSGSPYVADIHVQVREFLMQSDMGDQWKEWFLLKNRSYYKERAIKRMKRCGHFDTAVFEEKKKIAANFLAPFLYSEEEIMGVLKELDGSV